MAGRTRVKICGITRLEDALQAAQLGVDALGFVFVPASTRCIDVEAAAAIVKALPAFVTPVGLFLDASDTEVQGTLKAIPELVPQFHGRETPAQCEGHGCGYLKALALGEPSTAQGCGADSPTDVHAPKEAEARINWIKQYARASGFLLDSHAPGALGGTGVALDWDSLGAIKTELGGRPMILAGGLDPDNIGEAIAKTRPWAVDVSSGVESSKGIKSKEAMRAFMAAVSTADAHAH